MLSLLYRVEESQTFGTHVLSEKEFPLLVLSRKTIMTGLWMLSLGRLDQGFKKKVALTHGLEVSLLRIGSLGCSRSLVILRGVR